MSQAAIVAELEAEQLKKRIPKFNVGDTLKIHTRIIEGNKERVQIFTGTVIARTGSGLGETVSLYRIAYGSGMERVFLIHSPRLVKIEVSRRGKVRRSKLYYLRGRFGKASKVREKFGGVIVEEEFPAEPEEAVAPVEEVESQEEAVAPTEEKAEPPVAEKTEPSAKEQKATPAEEAKAPEKPEE